MKIRSLLLLSGIVAALAPVPARADITYTQGSGTTIFDFTCFTTKHCSAHVPVDSTGAAFGVAANPFLMGFGTGVTLPAYASTPTFNLGTIGTAATAANQGLLTTWAGGTLGAMATYGTSPGAVLVPGVNAFVTNTNANGRAVSGSSSPVVPTPALSTWHLIAAATTNATSVKGTAATVFSCQLANNSANIGYLKIYNKATAPTVGTDVPVKTLIIPGPTAGGGGSNISFGPGGLTLATGFAAAVTGVITDADTTAVAATAFAINCDYE